jgi:hypothetical protein
MPPKVLIAAPTAAAKDYCVDKYLDSLGLIGFCYPNAKHLLVDNTDDDGSHAQWLLAKGFDEVIAAPGREELIRILVTLAWEQVIIPYAWEHNFDYILSLETDIIAEPTTTGYLLNVAEQFDAAVVGHAYDRRKDPRIFPLKYQNGLITQSLGCSLFRRDFIAPGESLLDHFEVYLYDKARTSGRRVVLLENILMLEHLYDTTHEHGPSCTCCE